jgi:transposase-like protein
MTDRELERRANRRLAVLRHVGEVSGNVAATCRYYGISRQCYYGWLRRYGAAGLDGLKDRSSRPHHSPRVTQTEVIENPVVAEALPLRPGQDRHVSGSLPRHEGVSVRSPTYPATGTSSTATFDDLAKHYRSL